MNARNGPDKTEIPCRTPLESNLKPLFCAQKKGNKKGIAL